MAGSRLSGSGARFAPCSFSVTTTGECDFCTTCAGESPLRRVVVFGEKRAPGWPECRRGAADELANAGWRLFSRGACWRWMWCDGWFGFNHGVCSMNCSPAAPSPCTNVERPAA